MFVFWAVAGILTAVAAGLILTRAAGAADRAGADDPASLIYRRQLSEIDDLAERGLMAESERKAARAEAGRRLLAASEAQTAAWTSSADMRPYVLIAAVAAATLALGLYFKLGSPGAKDQPYATRLATWKRSDLRNLTAPEIAAVLRDATAARPNEAEGFRLLGLAEGASDSPLAAIKALRRATELAPERADLWALLGQAEVSAAGGKVDADAQAAFQRLLALDPGNPAARFFLAQAKADAGQRDAAVADLKGLLTDLPAGDDRRGAVEAQIAKVEGRATGVGSGNPQQLAMIQGMVQRLATRLETSPDDPDGWVRLVRAYAVLGDTAKRDAAYAKARARYAGRDDITRQLDDAARTEPMR